MYVFCESRGQRVKLSNCKQSAYRRKSKVCKDCDLWKVMEEREAFRKFAANPSRGKEDLWLKTLAYGSGGSFTRR